MAIFCYYDADYPADVHPYPLIERKITVNGAYSDSVLLSLWQRFILHLCHNELRSELINLLRKQCGNSDHFVLPYLPVVIVTTGRIYAKLKPIMA
jgi:hypothetical protein